MKIKLVFTISVIFLIMMLSVGCSEIKEEVKSVKESDPMECNITDNEKTVWQLIRVYKIECREGNYRCFHGTQSLQCFKLEE